MNDKDLALTCYYYDKPGTYIDDKNKATCTKDLAADKVGDCFIIHGNGHILNPDPVGRCLDFKQHL